MFIRRNHHGRSFSELDFKQSHDACWSTGLFVVSDKAKNIGLARFEAGGDIVELDRMEVVSRAKVKLTDPATAFVVAGILEQCTFYNATRRNGYDPAKIVGGRRCGNFR